MSKSNLTLEIENQAIQQFTKFGVFMCPEVTFERAWIKDSPANVSMKEFHTNPKYNQVEGKHIRTEIVDILELNSQKGWVCYEIKISKSDFHSKAIKSFVGDYNYYLMPQELYEQVENEIPKEIGVYTYKNKYLYCSKKARKQKLIEDMDTQLFYGMIRALNREREKQRDKIIALYDSNLREYMAKIKEEKDNKSSKLYKLKDVINKTSEQQQLANELEIELDVLQDVYSNLWGIVRKIY